MRFWTHSSLVSICSTQPARYKERTYAARPLLRHEQRGLLDALKAADPRTDEHARAGLIFILLRMPVGVIQRLIGRGHRKDDEIVDLAPLLRLHPVVRIICAIRTIAARYFARDLTGKIGNVEGLDALGRVFTRFQT